MAYCHDRAAEGMTHSAFCFHWQVKFEAAGFTYEAAEQLWGARTKAPYPRGSIHSAATQDAWREHTHLCCDIILLMSDFGQLR